MTTLAQYEEAFQSLLNKNTDMDFDRIERLRHHECPTCRHTFSDHGYSIIQRKVSMFCPLPEDPPLTRIDEATHHHH